MGQLKIAAALQANPNGTNIRSGTNTLPVERAFERVSAGFVRIDLLHPGRATRLVDVDQWAVRLLDLCQSQAKLLSLLKPFGSALMVVLVTESPESDAVITIEPPESRMRDVEPQFCQASAHSLPD